MALIMKRQREFPAVTITKKGEAAVKRGHPWIYAEEITGREGVFENGCLCDVYSQKGSWLGAGFFSEKSKIAVRVLSDNANESFSDSFFERRIAYALDYRLSVMGDISACRLIFGESDGLPGLTVDKYNDILVAQVLSFGMDKIKGRLFGILCSLLEERGEKVGGVYEREDVAIRELEGLEQYKGWYEAVPHGSETRTVITENGVKYEVDFENGQKTGFFLDQKLNRAALSRISRGRTVLDCFTHTGSFALNALKGGAKRVTAVDSSESALELARSNAVLNGAENIDFLRADVFDLLPELCEKGGSPYDLIVLDPPAFTKSRKTVSGAERGYKEINYRAMKLLPRGGYLATASCSHFMTDELFRQMLREAASDAAVTLKQIEARQRSPDHPVLWTVPETDYLKFYLFQIV